jgi:hypothetical protein
MNLRTPLLAALATMLLPASAFAQAWVGSPDFSEGIGIRAGNLELHPSIGAEFGYDSNFTRAAESEGEVDVLKLRITPSITLSTLGRERRNAAAPPRFIFSGSASASYFELFPTDSENSEIRKRRNVALGADFKADFLPAGKFGVDLLGGYTRLIDAEGRSDDLAGEGFNRDAIRGGAGVNWRPGGGLFDWRLGYTATYRFFEADQYRLLDNLHHEVGTRGRWRFLPRSALLFDSTYTFVRYTHSASTQTNGDAVRSRIGFHGLVTYHLALLAMVGWASSFYEGHGGSIAPRQFDSPIANAELRWFIQARPSLESASLTTGLSSVAVGYMRTFSNSYLGSFYQRDRGYLQFSMFLLGAVAGGLDFGVSRVGYPETGATPSFSQLRLDARAFGEYRFTDTLALNATVQYDRVSGPVVANEDLDYKRWQAYLGVRWFM